MLKRLTDLENKFLESYLHKSGPSKSDRNDFPPTLINQDGKLLTRKNLEGMIVYYNNEYNVDSIYLLNNRSNKYEKITIGEVLDSKESDTIGKLHEL